MPELLFSNGDGIVRKSAAGTVTNFSSTNIGTYGGAASDREIKDKIIRASNGNLLILGNGDGFTNVEIFRYNQEDETLDLQVTLDLKIPDYSTIYAFGDTIIVFSQNSVFTSLAYQYSADGGWTWSTEVNHITLPPTLTPDDIVFFKGTYYVTLRGSVNAYSFSLGAELTLTKAMDANHYNHAFAILNDQLFIFANRGSIITVYKLSAGTFVQKYTVTGLTGTTCRPGFIADSVNDKLYAIVQHSTGFNGFRSTDGTGETWQVDNTICSALSSIATATMIHTKNEPTITKNWQGIINRSTGYQLIEWDTSSISWSVIGSGGSAVLGGLVPYTDTAAFTRITPTGFNSGNTRYQFTLQSYNLNGSNNTIDPEFSINWEDWSNMTIDESKTGYVTVLNDILIGSDTNKFNDNFALDVITTEEGYETIQYSSDLGMSVGSGSMTYLIAGIGIDEYLKRFIITGNFKVSLSYSSLSATLATNNYLRFGIRAYPLGLNGKFIDPDNFVEMYVKKDTSIARYYQSNHIVTASDNFSSTVVTGANDDAAVWISRSGSIFTASYGPSETGLNHATTLSSSASIMIVIFVDNQDTASAETFDLDNLHLYNGVLKFIGGKNSIINWDFTTDGVIGDQGNITARVIGSS